MVGILSYGVYIPKYRIKTADIASVWGKEGTDIEKSLGVTEKSVAGLDEDSVTLAYEAASTACNTAIDPSQIDVCLVGSESHPYAVNPTSTIVAEFLGVGRNYLAVDLEFACKAGSTGMIAISGLISSGKAKMGLAIGTDKAQSKPHDILEYTAASAGAAFILGDDKKKIIAEMVDFSSYSSDTPDFWRRDGVRFPSHGGRFTGEPAYFEHVLGAAHFLMNKNKLTPADFDYCIFHMPNGKFPRDVAKRLGFTKEQLQPSLIVDYIGNPYSASSLMGLAATLDIAKADKLIFMASYGSGAGSDSFIFKTTAKITSFQKQHQSFHDLISKKKYISYVNYLKNLKKI